MTAPKHLTPEQKEFLDLYTFGTWIMNPETGLVDVEGSFDCHGHGLKSFSEIRFGHVSGSFNCSQNQLTTLEGAPASAGVVFYCYTNHLTSLEGAPQTVGGSFNCSNNSLTSLKGAPKSVGGCFYCYRNQLTSLEGAPESVGGDFNCDAFLLDAGEWNPSGWLKAAQESERTAELLAPLLSEDALDAWMLKHPLDLDLLNPFPELKSGVLKRIGIRDVSRLAAARRQGLV